MNKKHTALTSIRAMQESNTYMSEKWAMKLHQNISRLTSKTSQSHW